MKKSFKVSIIISLIMANIFLIFNVIPFTVVKSDNAFINGEVQISAHRGGALLNPENTRKAFDYVIFETNYVDIVEIDVRLTKDKIIVINHDSDVNRMALNDGEESVDISNHTYMELQNYNLGRNFVSLDGTKPYYEYSTIEAKEVGLTIMSLEDFFIRYKETRDIKLFLEIKESGDNGKYIVDRVEEMFNLEFTWWKERTMFITFDDELVDYIDKNYSSLYVGALGNKVVTQIVYNKLGLDVFYKPNFDCIQIPYNEKAKKRKINLLTKGIVNSAHKRNQSVAYWGVNNKEDMKKIIDKGADIITTDAPDVLARLLNRQ